MHTFTLLAAMTAMLAPGIPQLEIPGNVDATTNECRMPLPAMRAEDSSIITEPQGRRVDYALSSYYFSFSPLMGISYHMQIETACEVVFDDASGDVYLGNYFGGVATQSWLKGKRQGDKVTFDFPQVVSQTTDGTRYATVFNLEEEDEGLIYNVSDKKSLEFTLMPDGTLKSPDAGDCEADYPSFILGLTEPTDDYSEAIWSGFGDANLVYVPFNDEMLPVPENLDWQTFAMEHYSYKAGTQQTEFNRKQVQVAFQDGFAYLKGVSRHLPDAVIKGKLGDGKITFPTHQYMGKGADQFVYFEAAPFANIYNEEKEHYVPTLGDFDDYITFTYDAERRRITNAEKAIVFNCSSWRLYYLQYIVSPKLQQIDPAAQKQRPAKPLVRHWFPYQAGNLCYGYFVAILPDYDINGTPLEHDRLYYEVYFNGSDTPETFAGGNYLPTEDSYGGPMTQVPYDFTDNFNFVKEGDYTYQISYYDPFLSKIAVRLYYKDDSGKVLASDLALDSDEAYSDDPATDPAPDDVDLTDLGHSVITGLQSSQPAAVAARYNLQGIPVTEGYRGVQIIVRTDGTVTKTISR